MKYTFVKQHDITDCAAACMAMVCLHYRKETTITELRDIMGTDIKGTNLIGLSKCAENLGFNCQAVRVDRSGFLSHFTLPAIANVITKEGMSHFVVIFKITEKYVIIGDPAKDLQKIPFDDFYKKFTGAMLLLMPDQRFSNKKIRKKKIFDRYMSLLYPQRKLFGYALSATFLVTLLGIISSLFNSIIYDEILPYSQSDVLTIMLFVFLGISIVSTFVSFIRQWILMHLSIKIDIPLMLGYFEHVYKLPMKFFSTRRIGDITTRFSDAFTIKDIFTSISLSLVMDISMVIITGIILMNMNKKLFSVITIMTIISILLVYVFKRPYKKINEEQMQQSSILNSEIIEGLRGIETIKSNANEDVILEQLEREYIKTLKISYKEGMISNVQGTISKIIGSVGNMVLLYVGISSVINNQLTLGSYMAFMTLSSYFLDPISNLISLQLSIQEANISMKRLSEIMDYEREQDLTFTNELNMPSINEKSTPCINYTKLNNCKGDIKFENVTFRYGNRKPVLNNVSFTIPNGKKVALVGESGSGKSTIAKLLLKYYQVEDGLITINDLDINNCENMSLRKNISYVPQNVELFSKSIYENIKLSKSNASLEDVIEAARLAGADKFIRSLPMQYYTYLEEAGNGLSGGEKQRIALARAFLKKNDFYILDESTSNLDFATENIIFDMIYNKFREKTMLIIAHRLSTIRHCDCIFVMEKGSIVEQGTHDDLMKKHGQYYSLWQMQQGVFEKKEELIKEVIVDDEDTISYQ